MRSANIVRLRDLGRSRMQHQERRGGGVGVLISLVYALLRPEKF